MKNTDKEYIQYLENEVHFLKEILLETLKKVKNPDYIPPVVRKYKVVSDELEKTFKTRLYGEKVEPQA